jgi:hypothetical protein
VKTGGELVPLKMEGAVCDSNRSVGLIRSAADDGDIAGVTVKLIIAVRNCTTDFDVIIPFYLWHFAATTS